MWIVRLALARPYTFVVAAMLILIAGVVTILRMPTDILPNVDIPIVSVIWSYTGLPPREMERRMVTPSERAFTTTVNDLEHIESQSMSGVAVIKVYFQPGANVESAVAQITASSQSILRALPPGATAPLIVRYSASNVPILQATVHSDTIPEQSLFDYSTNFIRTPLATVRGAQIPLPYGGKPRGILVDIDPQALYARGLSPQDVSNAINAQNLILPAGTAKIGPTEYNVLLNSSPDVVDALNDLPIKQVGNTTIYIRDVAQVRDGFAVQQNIVRANGGRSSLITILKNGNASTLDVINRVKAALPGVQAGLPPELKIDTLFDQSVFVRASIHGVVLEGAIAACLTALMILLFLGSWRSTLIVTISIPLSILCSLLVLAALGQTINIMTLGGLALAVGILVDDATVEIENIHRNMAQKKPIRKAILDGAQEIAVPALVSTLSICIVFVPVAFIAGAAKSLFTPLAMAVAFAMLASYVLSRTLIPTMVMYLLRDEQELYREDEGDEGEAGDGKKKKQQGDFIWRFHKKFEKKFDALRDRYKNDLEWALNHRKPVFFLFITFVSLSMILLPFLGRDFFPQVDAGQIRLHVRAKPGTRIEETERLFARVEASIRETVPPSELELILDNIGIPVGGVNLAFSDSATIGPSDGEILVALHEGKHKPTRLYVDQLRAKLNRDFPEATFFFQPADIVGQILNFGLPSPIDIQISGPNKNSTDNLALAQKIAKSVSAVPGAVDVHVHQVTNVPDVRLTVDRTRASQIGLTQRDVASSLLISLSGSGQTAPNFWLNPQNGVSYSITVQTPQYRINTLDALLQTPIVPGSTAGSAGTDRQPQILGNLATVSRSESPANVNHYNVQPVYDVYASVANRDLGGVSKEIAAIVAKNKPPKGTTVTIKGQVESMNASFLGLGLGLVFAVVLVYALMAVNFQSWIDPLIIITALPGAFAGILWMLFATGTTLSVPAMMGMIMGIGVATANSILVVTFANEQRALGKNAVEAALEAGFTRLRPVLMTAIAMMIGMLPMALALSEGGEQNAPLGRAVIGALLVATFTTLFFVPVAYSVMRRAEPEGAFAQEEREEAEYERDHGLPFDPSLPPESLPKDETEGENGDDKDHKNGDGKNGDGQRNGDRHRNGNSGKAVPGDNGGWPEAVSTSQSLPATALRFQRTSNDGNSTNGNNNSDRRANKNGDGQHAK